MEQIEKRRTNGVTGATYTLLHHDWVKNEANVMVGRFVQVMGKKPLVRKK